MFFAFFFAFMIIKVSAVYPTIPLPWSIINIVIDVAVILFYFIVKAKNPGFVEKETNETSLTF